MPVGLLNGTRATGWAVPGCGCAFGLEHGHQDEVLPAVGVEPALAADALLAEAAGPAAADGAAVAGQRDRSATIPRRSSPNFVLNQRCVDQPESHTLSGSGGRPPLGLNRAPGSRVSCRWWLKAHVWSGQRRLEQVSCLFCVPG
jgi:hypothetical protein